MRYVVFADIHANLEALEAVLEEAQKHKPDKVICIGDIVGYGCSDLRGQAEDRSARRSPHRAPVLQYRSAQRLCCCHSFSKIGT